jgi:hypothetical protein
LNNKNDNLIKKDEINKEEIINKNELESLSGGYDFGGHACYIDETVCQKCYLLDGVRRCTANTNCCAIAVKPSSWNLLFWIPTVVSLLCVNCEGCADRKWCSKGAYKTGGR